MFKYVVFYALSALTLAISPVNAEDTCDSYIVSPGDTLRLISEAYYGTRDLSPIIYKANLGVVGIDPNIIEIGMELSIPCREGIRTPPAQAFLAIVDGAENPQSERPAPMFVAQAGSTTFIEVDSTGIVPDILAAALEKGGYSQEINIARPSTEAEVLQVASTENTLLSFPWIRFDCAETASLSLRSQNLCRNYTLSDPLFEITLGLFTLKESPLLVASTADAFAGVTICTTRFYGDDLLRLSGIINQSAQTHLEPTVEHCLEAVQTGKYDAMVADYQTIATLTPDGISDIPPFAQQTTLHAAAFTENETALAVLQMANTGLEQILKSGEWFGIVQNHLASATN